MNRVSEGEWYEGESEGGEGEGVRERVRGLKGGREGDSEGNEGERVRKSE